MPEMTPQEQNPDIFYQHTKYLERVKTGSDKSVPNKENWLKKKEKNNYRGKGAFDILLSRCHVTLLKVEEEK